MSAPTECIYVSSSVPLEGNDGEIKEKLLRTDKNTTPGSVEPPHHHTNGDQIFIIEGQLKVEMIASNHVFDLGPDVVMVVLPGDFLYIPGGAVHRITHLTDVKYVYMNDGAFDGPFWDSEDQGVIYKK